MTMQVQGDLLYWGHFVSIK